jgi:LPXTG-site transpeptidase (sortase) family protein
VKLDAHKKSYLRFLPNALLGLGVLFVLISFGPVVVDEAWFYFKEFKSQDISLEKNEAGVEDSVFARFLSTKPINIEPVNKDFSIVIEKLGVNAPIVADVPVYDEEVYIESLKDGVAHASISPYPSDEPGNVYLFAHASLDFWRLGKYSHVFNLLRKLEIGDRIHVFYKGDDYVYEVVAEESVVGWDTRPLQKTVIEPILTLQTCDPPGTTLNRYVITAKLLEIKEALEVE